MQGIGQGTARLPLAQAGLASRLSEEEGVRRQSNLRLAAGLLVLGLWTVGVWSLDWDADWHSRVGRDGFWTPPHLVFYTMTATTGLLCAGLVLLETFLYRRQFPGYNDQTTTRVLYFFRGPMGYILAGFGMVVMLGSAPLDDYWHRIYGIDVKVWAPFHVMLLIGIIMANLGIVYLFASEVNRRRAWQAEKGKAPQTFLAELRSLAEPATFGLIAATLFLITRYMLLMGVDTASRGTLTLGGGDLPVYHLPSYSLVLMALPVALVGVAGATGRVGTATLTGLLFVGFHFLDNYLINLGVNYLVKDQGRTLRAGADGDSQITWIYPLFVPLAGLLIDGLFWLTRRWRKEGPAVRTWLVGAGAGLGAGLVLFLLDKPWDYINDLIRRLIQASGNQAAIASIDSRLFHPDYWLALPLVIVLAALAGLVGWGWSLSLRYTDR